MKEPTETVIQWLQANLGSRATAPLTGSDTRALKAAVQIVELYSYVRNDRIAHAFKYVVEQMQESTKELAFHSIAHVLDWDDRDRLWQTAGLPFFAPRLTCAFGPGGDRKERE